MKEIDWINWIIQLMFSSTKRRIVSSLLIDWIDEFFDGVDVKRRHKVKWSLTTLIAGLAIDHQRYLYVSDTEKDEVRRYTIGDKNGIVVAGGNGRGNQLNQLNFPTYLFVDEEQAVYVSDWNNHRVMKWNKGAKEGICCGWRTRKRKCFDTVVLS